MPRHRFQHVVYVAGTRPSALKLDKALIRLGYVGRPQIAWGVHRSNKRLQLTRMRAAGVPTPASVEYPAILPGELPVVARTDHHRAGSGFWLCNDANEIEDALTQGATHLMEFIENAREFRVHIVNGKSIKLTEKLYVDHEVDPDTPGVNVRSHANGWHQLSPGPGAHRKTLRKHAKHAVSALGLTFGAVDILMRTDELHEDVNGRPDPITEFYVLEVNTAPALTDPNTDTCERYAQAFARG